MLQARARALPAVVWIALEVLCSVVALLGAALVGSAAAGYLATGAHPSDTGGPPTWPSVPGPLVARAELGNLLFPAGLIAAAIAAAPSVWAIRMPWLALRLALGPVTAIAIGVAMLPVLRLVFLGVTSACEPGTSCAYNGIPDPLAGNALGLLAVILYALAWLAFLIVTLIRVARGRPQ